MYIGIKLSDSTVAHLLATNTNHHYVKCIDIYPQAELDILLAVGQDDGKVVLTTFGPTIFDSYGYAGKELGKKSKCFSYMKLILIYQINIYF